MKLLIAALLITTTSALAACGAPAAKSTKKTLCDFTVATAWADHVLSEDEGTVSHDATSDCLYGEHHGKKVAFCSNPRMAESFPIYLGVGYFRVEGASAGSGFVYKAYKLSKTDSGYPVTSCGDLL